MDWLEGREIEIDILSTCLGLARGMFMGSFSFPQLSDSGGGCALA